MMAPTNAKAWGSGLYQWLLFTKLIGITVRGSGTLDGRGSVWWQNSDDPIDDESKLIIPINKTILQHPSIPIRSSFGQQLPGLKPTAMRFYGSFNVTVTGITIQNSMQCHLKFDNCIGVSVYNFTVTSPGDSESIYKTLKMFSSVAPILLVVMIVFQYKLDVQMYIFTMLIVVRGMESALEA
ncbi:hypothetical protein LIER_36960 [Lithospermum erythrorhizon]|uniref:Polygalacturonase n=1 Tax=Lithospermum erythrorhizon TaxID=34254 RepID=A0AAV3PHX6_LITER